ncbi:arginase family protein [Leucobacter sp. cx-328]|uniref:arginase family protein n=1 Tax=unclassified Leucobacter TaxID=2621730 RepID=UPI00165EBBE0|nr:MULTISPECIES: arginase family protein [unclassified Leucobacter]MBC9943365.1 arginase family protein [Leucobacter sp. cx-328]
MSASFLLIPEWQGSGASRALRIVDGARSLREDLPSSAITEVSVQDKAGDALGTSISRLSSIIATRDATRDAMRHASAPVIALGGDCASALGVLEHTAATHERLAVIWFDAHPDMQHPDTTQTGSAAGMTLRHALGDGAPDLAFTSPVAGERTLLVGTRDTDEAEFAAIEAAGLSQITAADLMLDPDLPLAVQVTDWLRDVQPSQLYVHVDLDVLDPAEFDSVTSGVPFGLSVADVVSTIRAAREVAPLVSAAICGFAPASAEQAADDQGTVLRILGALTAGGGA